MNKGAIIFVISEHELPRNENAPLSKEQLAQKAAYAIFSGAIFAIENHDHAIYWGAKKTSWTDLVVDIITQDELLALI